MAIFVFPMLTSSSVSPAASPGIAKVMERFVLVYAFDKIMRISKIKAKQPIQVTGSGGVLRLKEDRGLMFLEDYIEEQKKKDQNDISSWPRSKLETELKREWEDNKKTRGNVEKYTDEVRKMRSDLENYRKTQDKEKIRKAESNLRDAEKNLDRSKKDLEKSNKELERLKSAQEQEKRKREIARDRRERGKVDVRTVQLGGEITAEPTWVKVDTATGSSVIGVKVIPFPVHSDATLGELMMSDRQMKMMMAITTSIYRRIIKTLYNAWYATVGKLPYLGRSPITGDPRHDIIFSRSIHRELTFVCLSTMDFDNEFFRDAGGVAKLHLLGWKSFAVADDINKRAYFCMREFGGMCSAVQYSFIYSSLQQSKVYEDLEDVRKAASPFFKLQKKSSQLFGEHLAASKLEHFLPEPQLITEDLKSFINRMSPSRLKDIEKDFGQAITKKDAKNLERLFSRLKVPAVDVDKLERISKKSIPDFKKNFELSKKVLVNSLPNVPEKLIPPFAALVAIKSSANKENSMVETKKNLKILVARLRSQEAQRIIKSEKIAVYVLISLIGLAGVASIFTTIFVTPAAGILVLLWTSVIFYILKGGPEPEEGGKTPPEGVV